MSEVEDAVSEAIEQGRDSRLKAAVAILVALTATFISTVILRRGDAEGTVSQVADGSFAALRRLRMTGSAKCAVTRPSFRRRTIRNRRAA